MNQLIKALVLALFFSTCTDVIGDDFVLTYELDLTNAKNHYVTVQARITPTGNTTTLMMPVWTPGSYLIREFPRHIDLFEIVDEQNRKVDFEKTRKNRWTVNSKNVDELFVTYRIYCNDLSVRTNFVDGNFAVLNGAPTFLTVPDYRDRKHSVRMQLPKKWKRSATSLDSSDNAHCYVAHSFDELVDSPIVAGNIHIYPFEVSGVRHELVNVGESGYWDGNKAAADLKKVVVAHHQLWETIPYTRYLFINVICGRGGGLEHDNSTVMMTSRWSFRDEDRYLNWLSLASHEFFHTWNVRRLRPKALMNYDYEKEVYTPSLWIAEGITSYYEDLLLVRAGILDREEFLDRFSSNISSVQNRPGRLVQSLRESSFDSWIKFYRSSENASETQISYYSKGAVVGCLLDAKIRSLTNGNKSLDDVMKKMFNDYAATGYTTSDFRACVAEICGQELTDFFSNYVDTATELDFSNMKDLYGLRFPGDEDSNADNPQSEKTVQAQENKKSEANVEQDATKIDEFQENEKPWLGFSLNGANIANVQLNSPASDCGLNSGDELIAINGVRIKGSLDRRLRQFEIGDELELLISRREILSTQRLLLRPKPEVKKWDLKKVSHPSDEQQRNYDDWLSIHESTTLPE